MYISKYICDGCLEEIVKSEYVMTRKYMELHVEIDDPRIFHSYSCLLTFAQKMVKEEEDKPLPF